MENWIGVGIWIVLGAVIGLSMRVVVKLDQETLSALLAPLG